MLTNLRLQNFKSWEDTGDIPLKPITAFFGTNSSGKSSLLQALLLLKQTAESSDRGAIFHFGDPGSYADLGDFPSVVHGHNTDRPLGISLDWTDEEPLEVRNTITSHRVAHSKDLGFQVTSSTGGLGSRQLTVVNEMSYKVGDAVFGMRRSDVGTYAPFTDARNFRLLRRRGRPVDFDSLSKCYGFPPTVRASYRNADFLSDLEFSLEQCLDNINYLGPLRAYPKRAYLWPGIQPTDVGQMGELVVGALLAAGEWGQETNPFGSNRRVSLEQYVAYCLKELGLIHDFRIELIAEGNRLFQVKVRKSREAPEVLLTDVGFGVSQVLPAIVLCFYVPEGSTIILEQPEIHLHPTAQSGLADVFIDAIQKRKVQIIIESHSEHLLQRLQRRIAEKKISHEDVGLYFCTPGDGSSQLATLQLDPYGNIANWPKDFSETNSVK